MGITVHNATDVALTIIDFYVKDPGGKVGCFGLLRYCIPPGGSRCISASELRHEWASQMLGIQQLHVLIKDGKKSGLWWEHGAFVEKEGKVVTIEMVGDDLREKEA